MCKKLELYYKRYITIVFFDAISIFNKDVTDFKRLSVEHL